MMAELSALELYTLLQKQQQEARLREEIARQQAMMNGQAGQQQESQQQQMPSWNTIKQFLPEGASAGTGLGSAGFFSGQGSLPAIFGGTSTVGGGTQAGFTPSFMSAIGGPSTGMGASGGSAGGGSGLASLANPWTALAALVVGNELQGRNSGRRAENPWEQTQDALTGRALSRDAEHFVPKIFGDDKFGLGGDTIVGANLINPSTWFSGGLGDAWDAWTHDGTLAKGFKALGKLF